MCDQQRLRPACAYAQSDQRLCLSLEYSMTVKLLTEHHLRFLSLKGGCTCSPESTLVKMPHCWKSRVTTICRKTNYQISIRFRPGVIKPLSIKSDKLPSNISRKKDHINVADQALHCLSIVMSVNAKYCTTLRSAL